MSRFAICFALAAFAAAPATADEFRPSTSIQSVIVYPAGAGVTRTVPIELPAGPSVVTINDLPLEIETDSITVDGATDTRLEIGSVATRIIPADAAVDPARKAILEEIRDLEDQRATIADRIGALDGRRKFIEKMLETVPGGFGKALGEGGSGIEQWSPASKALGDELDAVAIATRALQREDRGIGERVDQRNKALNELPSPRDRLEVKIELAADAPAKGVLTIGYRTPSAWWVPTYHVLLTTGEGGVGKPALEIVRRAEVTQTSGEDWSDVALTLSTVRPAGGTAAPLLEASIAAFVVGYGGESASYRRPDTLAPPPPSPEARASEDSAAVSGLAEARPVIPVEAKADFGDFRAEYDVPGRISLASGVGSRAFRISTETGTPELEVRAVPVLSPAAYLTARFMAPSAAPLLAGKVSLFRDGAFVGQGMMPFANGGTRIDLGFGVDDRVKVTRVALDRAVGETGILTSRHTDTRRFRIKVENLHEQPMSITVLDRVPYSEDEKIVIARLDDGTAPTAENVDDRHGVLAWTFTYGPGESRDIQNAYKVSWPAGETVVLAD